MILEQQLEDIRSPNLISDVAKGLMPYHGIGSGESSVKMSGKMSVEMSGKNWNAPENAPVNAPVKGVRPSLEELLMEWIAGKPTISYDELATRSGKDRSTIRRNLARLKESGRLRRIGPDKGGHWEVVS